MRTEKEIRDKIITIREELLRNLMDDGFQLGSNSMNHSLREVRIRTDTLLWVLGLKTKFSEVKKPTKKRKHGLIVK